MYPEGYITFPVPPYRKSPPPEGFGDLTEPMEIPKGWNTAVLTNNFCVIDLDNPALIDRFQAKYREYITTIIETPTKGGRHYYGANLVHNQQNPGTFDVRGWHGYVVGAMSRTRTGIYRIVNSIVPISELKAFPEELFEKRARRTAPKQEIRKTGEEIRNVLAYIRKIVAIQGNGGSNRTFEVACKLRDAGKSEVEAFAEMIEWNKTNAVPPWSTKELLHKIHDAFHPKETTYAGQREERQEVREV